ncbi:MAG: response regulator [Dehalococcoidales bacterium]|nr:response regulator [Dehalococcoidales bacterium]
MARSYCILLGGDPFGSLVVALEEAGMTVVLTASEREELDARDVERADVVVVADDKMGNRCLAVLRSVRDRYPDLPIILLGRHCQVDLAVQALKLGSVEYLTRPISPHRLCDKIEDAVERRDCLRELTRRTPSQV